MASEQIYLLLFAAVVLVVVVVALALYTLQRIRRRKQQILGELKHSPRLDSDRAFNRIVMARREADIVGRQGKDVSRAREQIAQAQAQLDLRNFARAYELAQSAHESLVQAYQSATPGAPLPAADPIPSRASPRSASASLSPPMRPAAGAAPPPITPIPRGRMEAQFEMRLLEADLARASAERPSDPATLSGVDFQDRARTAFDAGQFAEAFRFALKGRRNLGGKVEAVAPGPGSAAGGEPLDASAAAESAASASRCAECGYPTTPADAFCRGCGTPRTPSTCPRCGAPRTAADTFCGRCGERFS